MFPDGRAARLMARIQFPCAHCGGAFHEPLTMAAKRHANDPRKVLELFRSLERGGPTDEEIAEAMEKHGPGAKVIVLPYARYQLPRNLVRMEAEPLRFPQEVVAH